MFLVSLVLAFALAGYHQPVAADSCPNTSLSALAASSCDTIEGSLTISSSSTGNATLYLPSIEEITGDLTITNSGLTSVYFPVLQTVEGSVTVKDNDGLKNLTLSQLETVEGGLEVQGNKALKSVDLHNLQDVSRGLTLDGGFGIALPNIDEVNGDTTIRGSGISCGLFDRLAADGAFSGSYTCSSSDGGGLSAGAKAGIAVGVIFGVLIAVALIWWLVYRRKRTAPVDDERGPHNPSNHEKTGLKIPRKPFPPQRPVEPQVPLLDSGTIHEAPTERRDARPAIYELDAGPQSQHQRPIHNE